MIFCECLEKTQKGERMNKNALRSVMILHGDNYASLAKKMGIGTSTLSDKINERQTAGFTQPEIIKIKDIYGLDANQVDEIFFAKAVSEQDT